LLSYYYYHYYYYYYHYYITEGDDWKVVSTIKPSFNNKITTVAVLLCLVWLLRWTDASTPNTNTNSIPPLHPSLHYNNNNNNNITTTDNNNNNNNPLIPTTLSETTKDSSSNSSSRQQLLDQHNSILSTKEKDILQGKRQSTTTATTTTGIPKMRQTFQQKKKPKKTKKTIPKKKKTTTTTTKTKRSLLLSSSQSMFVRRIQREWKDSVQMGIAYDWVQQKPIRSSSIASRQQTKKKKKKNNHKNAAGIDVADDSDDDDDDDTNSTTTSTTTTETAREQQEPIHLCMGPLGSNLFVWHFSILGLESSPYEGGIYHGRMILPPNYPAAPPRVQMWTPSGRFVPLADICLSASAFHPETWKPSAWNLRTLIESLRLHFITPATEIGGMSRSPEDRRAMAIQSRSWKQSFRTTTKVSKKKNNPNRTTTTAAAAIAAGHTAHVITIDHAKMLEQGLFASPKIFAANNKISSTDDVDDNNNNNNNDKIMVERVQKNSERTIGNQEEAAVTLTNEVKTDTFAAITRTAKENDDSATSAATSRKIAQTTSMMVHPVLETDDTSKIVLPTAVSTTETSSRSKTLQRRRRRRRKKRETAVDVDVTAQESPTDLLATAIRRLFGNSRFRLVLLLFFAYKVIFGGIQ